MHLYDNNTVQVRTSGYELVRVRFLGIDAAEVRHSRSAGQCFGTQATGRLTPPGSTVTLTRDQGQPDRDRYGRLVRYLGLEDGRDVGAVMVRRGAARAGVAGYHVAREERYRQAQTSAVRDDVGMHAACDRR